MSELQKIFKYEGNEVRTVVDETGTPWWVAADICQILGIAKHRDAMSRLSDKQRGSVVMDTLGGKQEMAAVNEAGLYKLAFTSRKAAAEKFTDWVASEVLPSIRKTGKYETAPALPQTFSEALRMLADSVETVETQKKALTEAAPKVAFADAVNDSSNSMDLGVFAKILGTGRTRLFEWLREQGFLMATGTKPYQKYLDNGYFVVIETTFTRGDTTQSYGKTQICGKGQIAIQKIWAGEQKEAA